MMSSGRTRRRWFWLLKNTLNRATLRLGKSGRGPISVIRHTGRKSGRVYETPLLLATHDGDFVAELTYGPSVDWYRNVEAAGHCTILSGGVEYEIDAIRPCDPAVGMR